MRDLRGDWRDLFNGFSVALDLKKLLLGFIAIALSIIIGGVGIFALACIKSPELWADFKAGDFGCFCALYQNAWQIILSFPLWGIVLTFAGLYLFVLIIWAYFGGAITRIAAINLTKDEGLETGKALSFAGRKFISYLMPEIICILGFLFFFFWNFLGGVFGRIPYVGEILVMLFLPLAILSGFIMVFIIIGYLFSWKMFYPTIGVEGSDSFDALSRSFSYLYARPWHYIWYQLVSCVYGAVTTAFVLAFGYFMIIVSLWAGAVGMGGKFTNIVNQLGIDGHFGFISSLTGLNLNLNWLPQAVPNDSVTMTIAAFILAVWLVLVVGFIVSYVVSYFLSSQTIVYLLMRKKVDEIDVKEVCEEEEPEEAAPMDIGTTPPASGEVKSEEKKEEPKA